MSNWTVIALALVAFAILTTEIASAEDRLIFMTGDRLFEVCQSPATNYVCIGYIEGAVDEATAIKKMHIPFRTTSGKIVDIYSDSACYPPGVDPTQVRDVVVRYMEIHPEMRHLEATALVYFALREAFPCH